ncbi:MAG TPA: hypothetical protein PLV92_28275, partial [Pirellulaceae bacterium]|nr:hypothetical protein [Pirellulaceae bacterium]
MRLAMPRFADHRHDRRELLPRRSQRAGSQRFERVVTTDERRAGVPQMRGGIIHDGKRAIRDDLRAMRPGDHPQISV